MRLEEAAGALLSAGPGHGGRLVLAVTLHNLPEGMVVGLAAALALTGEPEAVSGAAALALGIGLQNIPEGAAVSLPLLQEGRPRGRAFLAGAASGMVEPLGGPVGLWNHVLHLLQRPFKRACPYKCQKNPGENTK